MSETISDAHEAGSPARDHGIAGALDGEDYVRWAYRLLLGREPESLSTVQDSPFKHNRRGLVDFLLNSDEFYWNHATLHAKYKAITATTTSHPYASWSRDTVAFVHLPKTGGTTLHTLLSGCFPRDRICPQRQDALHFYSAAELARYDFFSGHFDHFSLRFIPRKYVRRISIFRDPVKRLISWYRFCKSYQANRGGPYEDTVIKLANELSAEEFFEHDAVTSSSYTNNTYLFYFGSSSYDFAVLGAVAHARRHLDAAAADALADELCAEILAQATQTVRGLDAIGLTERFQESVETIFPTLGFPVPASILSQKVTDELASLDARASPVPPVEMTPRLTRALERLTKYDRVIYDAANQEFERRRTGGAPSSEKIHDLHKTSSNGRGKWRKLPPWGVGQEARS